jgi:hypothetical protein
VLVLEKHGQAELRKAGWLVFPHPPFDRLQDKRV